MSAGARRPRRRVRNVIGVATAALVVAGVGVAGRAVPAERPSSTPPPEAVVGKTSSVCTPDTLGSAEHSGAGSRVIAAAATKRSSSPTGKLTVGALDGSDSGGATVQAGTARLIDEPEHSLVLTADQEMAAVSAGMVFGSARTGKDRGLSLAPCTRPAVDQWFTGLAAGGQLTSRLVLTNPDDRQAEVELAMYGQHGRLQVPGTSSIKIPARTRRTVSLADLLTDGDRDQSTKDQSTNGTSRKGKSKKTEQNLVTVHVRARSGRIAAIARDRRSDAGTPMGAAWHAASATPAKEQVLPAVPGGGGSRTIMITNPNDRRAQVRFTVLGKDGRFTPAGADTVSVGGNSSATVDLATGLAEQTGTVVLRSDQPVTAAARSSWPAGSGSGKKHGDIAVQPPEQPIRGFGVLPAAAIPGTTGVLALSNAGSATTKVSVTVAGLDGEPRTRHKLLIPAGSTIEQKIDPGGPAYAVVRSGSEADVYGGITLHRSGTDRKAKFRHYGLTTAALIAPDEASKAPPATSDPHVAR